MLDVSINKDSKQKSRFVSGPREEIVTIALLSSFPASPLPLGILCASFIETSERESSYPSFCFDFGGAIVRICANLLALVPVLTRDNPNLLFWASTRTLAMPLKLGNWDAW